MHDALDAEGAAVPVEEQMTVEGFPNLDAANAGEFWGGEVAANAEVGLLGDALDRFMDSEQITLGNIEIGIFQILAVLQSHVLLSPPGDEDPETHAWAREFCRMRSSTEAS
ncbi:MAG: hypothetical protein ABL974_21075 [Prosthecobacter sp.]